MYNNTNIQKDAIFETNKKKSLNIIKCMLFLAIFFFLCSHVFHVLWLNKNPISFFYKEKKNTMDIIYIGASNAYAHFNTTLAYDLYGYTTGLLASDAQPFAATKYLIQEAQKYQKPELYIIDIASIAKSPSEFKTEYIRNCVDAMRFSKNRINAINDLLSYTNVDKEEYINYYLSFLMYHTRWKNISESNWNQYGLYKGYLFYSDTTKIVPNDEYTWEAENTTELPEENKQILNDLIEYIKTNNINVLFTVPMRYFEEVKNERLNDAISIIQNNNLNIINFNMLEDFNINLDTDFYNRAHLNVYGATKYTLYFAKYLKEHYNLQDHRNDENYFSWKYEYERFKRSFRNLTKKDFEKLLLEYEEYI